eukprot:scaffold1759_cov284-Prasinococcus_capsulatus_cf.AAC.2
MARTDALGRLRAPTDRLAGRLMAAAASQRARTWRRRWRAARATWTRARTPSSPRRSRSWSSTGARSPLAPRPPLQQHDGGGDGWGW